MSEWDMSNFYETHSMLCRDLCSRTASPQIPSGILQQAGLKAVRA